MPRGDHHQNHRMSDRSPRGPCRSNSRNRRSVGKRVCHLVLLCEPVQHCANPDRRLQNVPIASLLINEALVPYYTSSAASLVAPESRPWLTFHTIRQILGLMLSKNLTPMYSELGAGLAFAPLLSVSLLATPTLGLLTSRLIPAWTISLNRNS